MDERANVGAVTIESERAIAQVKAAVTMAKMYPRDKYLATEKILAACKRLDLAEVGLYSYPRGGKKVEGPSIRLAEIIGNAWGNLDIGVAELSQSPGMSEWLAFAWDLETNTRWAISFQVKHERHSGAGVKDLDDPRDIYEAGANMGSRRKRACILAAVDQDVINAAVAQVRATIAASVGGKGSKTLEERLGIMVRKFEAIGIKVLHLTQRLGHSIAEVTSDEYVELCGIYKSLEDKQSAPADWFAAFSKGTVADTKAAEVDQKLKGETPPEPEIENPCGNCGKEVPKAQAIDSKARFEGKAYCKGCEPSSAEGS
jgi:hypothetical protein